MTLRHSIWVLCVLFCGLVQGRALDLGNAVLLSAPNLSGPQRKALVMLVEEVEKRTGIRWQETTNWPAPGIPVVVAGVRAGLGGLAVAYAKDLESLPAANGAEGYQLSVKEWEKHRAVFITGNDSRGLLFGAGRLLRELQMERGRVSVADSLDIFTAPKYALRGHQLGYRPKSNSYDAWDLPTWEQYIS